MTDVAHPAVKMSVVHRHAWEGGWTTEPGPFLSGSVSRRFDSARTCLLVVPNADGETTDLWKVGDRIEVRIGWNQMELHPLFQGVVPPGRGVTVGGGLQPTLRVAAVDLFGLVEKESILIDPAAAKTGSDETSYAGWEAATAIRDVLATSQASTFLGDISPIDYTGVVGSNPIRRVGNDFDEPTGLQGRKAFADAILAQMTDDETDPDRPRPYHYWQSDTYDQRQAVFLQKERDPASSTPVRTITAGADLLDAKVEVRTNQATSALVRSSKDATKSVRFSDDDAIARFGRLEARIVAPFANTDELLQVGRRAVSLQRYPVRSFTVAVRDGFRHELNQVVALVNPKYGGSGNYLVTGVDVAFSPTDVSTQIRLSAPEELLTEALA